MLSPEIKDIFNQAVVALFTVVILPCIPMVWKLAKTYFEAKIELIKNKQVQEAIEFAFQRLDHIVNNTVAEISQVATKSTGLSAEEQTKRRDLAYKRIRAQIADKDYAILQTSVKNIDRYIFTKIESSRYFQKQECA